MALFRPLLAFAITALLLAAFLSRSHVFAATLSDPNMICETCGHGGGTPTPAPSGVPTNPPIPTPPPRPTPVPTPSGPPCSTLNVYSAGFTFAGTFNDTTANIQNNALEPNFPTDPCAQMFMGEYRYDASDTSGKTWEAILLCQGDCVTFTNGTVENGVLNCYSVAGTAACGVMEENQNESMPAVQLVSNCSTVTYYYNNQSYGSTAVNGCSAYLMAMELISAVSPAEGAVFGNFNPVEATNPATSNDDSTWTSWPSQLTECSEHVANQWIGLTDAISGTSGYLGWEIASGFSCRNGHAQ